jgi:2'-5' RNA ligase
MAIDHFAKHAYQSGRSDWNFNITFRDQLDVARMLDEYGKIIAPVSKLLYAPIPLQWLHLTILRAGFFEDFSVSEMQTVAQKLEPIFANFDLSELAFDSWWLLYGNVILHVSPGDKIEQCYNAIVDMIHETLGADRLKIPLGPHGSFTPHVTLAYTKSHHRELELNAALSTQLIKPAHFKIEKVSLLRQWPADGHYEWDVIREIPVGKPSARMASAAAKVSAKPGKSCSS